MAKRKVKFRAGPYLILSCSLGEEGGMGAAIRYWMEEHDTRFSHRHGKNMTPSRLHP